LTHDDLVEAVEDGRHKLYQETVNKWAYQVPKILLQSIRSRWQNEWELDRIGTVNGVVLWC
jgi:hypothetical protein